MDRQQVAQYLATLAYGPAPESPEPALGWLRAHHEKFGHFIGGTLVGPASGRYFPTVNPANGNVLAQIAQGTVADVDAAMQAAKAAFPRWRDLPAVARGKHLYNIQRVMEKHARLFQVLESLDNGKTFRETRDIDVPLAIRHFRYHAGWAVKAAREYPSGKPGGVVAQIIPWNFPLLMLAWKVAPAIAVGNTVVLKPAEFTPLTALLFAEILEEAGLPPGVVNIVTGDGQTGELLVNHSVPWKIAFTGSTEVGRRIRVATANSSKALSLELGGKSAFIVFADADLDSAVEGVVDAIWFNQGQVCCAGSRLLMEESVAEDFLARLRRRMRTLRGVGPGISQLDKAIDIGAINSAQQLEKITRLCRIGQEEGATMWQPESWSCPSDGWFFPPTLFTNVNPASTIAQEEIFGPVLVSMTFRTPAEAVELANNTPYGLAASIWTENIGKALEVAKRVVAGTVWVNSTNLFDAASGFGGYRESGFGREGGPEGVREYLKETHKRSGHYGIEARSVAQKTVEPHVRSEPLLDIDRTYRFLIGGKLARPDGQASFSVRNPAGEVLAVCADANRKDVRNAVRAAREAVPTWANTTADLRGKILCFAAENLEKHQERFAALLQQCGYGTRRAHAEVRKSVDRLLFWGGYADKFGGTVQQVPMPAVVTAIREPRGVLAVRAPDDCPLLGFVSTLGPAFAMGNAVVMVAGKNPLPALELLQILQASEIPASTLNILTAEDPDAAAKVLAEHKDVDALWCYGSKQACAAVKAASVSNMKKTVTNDGHQVDWFGAEGESDRFLWDATNTKNIWIPSGW
ncbi:MAG: aldehyde dehydrogenase [Candidatus Terrybacteria bacterium RIFCSPHIGHO2_01_FULL_58_15]|uniref:Aldehyde dehydrogenase n=1 Tax=Terrybacteria sp. (strain RIFCSPHIGHO2_01_FULL_58_15) TaxID=1802363 RepID=A0A1G2PNE8_TERXR|nr:MAG: aldehyde dehydrogenase [Candidatus Terrybacteria bacterium RIFCSPHIGHO2_01_FULL_58_15]